MSTTVTIGSGSTRVSAGGPTKRVTLNRSTVAQIRDHRPRMAVVSNGTNVVVDSGATTVRTGGGMGVQGPPGVTEGTTFNAPAGETIHGHRAVRIVDGELFHPNVFVADHADQVVGIALNSAAIGETVTVRTQGEIIAGFWSWSAGYVYVGTDGQLTQSPATTGWLLEVGRVKDSTSVDVDIEVPIYRS